MAGATSTSVSPLVRTCPVSFGFGVRCTVRIGVPNARRKNDLKSEVQDYTWSGSKFPGLKLNGRWDGVRAGQGAKYGWVSCSISKLDSRTLGLHWPILAHNRSRRFETQLAYCMAPTRQRPQTVYPPRQRSLRRSNRSPDEANVPLLQGMVGPSEGQMQIQDLASGHTLGSWSLRSAWFENPLWQPLKKCLVDLESH